MFFHINEKTLKDIIENQKQREAEKVQAEPTIEYDGHKLKFIDLPDGSVIIDADPPLVTEAKEASSE